jgi:hypothetical protein
MLSTKIQIIKASVGTITSLLRVEKETSKNITKRHIFNSSHAVSTKI